MKAMILAAGVGSRLDPLTRSLPKPMVPIVGRPVIEHIVLKLKKHGITDIYVNVSYLGHVIADFLSDGSKFGVNITCAVEDQLWGDAGSVRNAYDFFKDGTFLVVGGDDISDMDLSALLAFHAEKKAASTIALTEVDDPSQFGIVLTDPDGRINRFLEKPKGEVFSKTANTGVYVFEPDVLDLIPPGTFYGFGNEVFPQLLKEGRPLYGWATTAFWKDVGNIAVYKQTNVDALTGKVSLSFPMTQNAQGVWVGDGAQIDPTATIETPAAIGAGAIVGADVKIGPNTVIGAGARVDAGATVNASILWEGAIVEAGTHLERCIVGAGASVSSTVGIFDGIIVDPRRPA